MRRIKEECDAVGVKVVFEKVSTGFQVTFYRPEIKLVKEQKVTDNQRQILEAISKNPHITALELAGILSISERKTKENIKKLKEKAFLRRIGPDKGGHWKIIGE